MSAALDSDDVRVPQPRLHLTVHDALEVVPSMLGVRELGVGRGALIHPRSNNHGQAS